MMENIMTSFTIPGFLAAAVAAGIKNKSSRLDLGLIQAPAGAAAAGLFTTNRVAAPAVVLGRERIRAGRISAVLVNSGNANTAVGPRGRRDTRLCTGAAAHCLGLKPDQVLMSSTGVIGEPLPVDRLLNAVPGLVRALRPDGFQDFARAIMTTDTKMKLIARELRLGSSKVKILGAAKGSGMIQPRMATMLVYLLTDAAAPALLLRRMLREAAEDTFNALSVDGDTSTSDTVLLLASGQARNPALRPGSAATRVFLQALKEISAELSDLVVADGEGATRLFRVEVSGARTREQADRVARRIANSPLVKTAFHAADPNWGRVLAAAGSAGVPIDPARLELWFADESNRRQVPVMKAGAPAPGYREQTAAAILRGKSFRVRLNLHQGRAGRTITTCDFSADYVRINAEYRS
jgi:glutamate N-acetyltransferase / amino-acid N-acetyltransferase